MLETSFPDTMDSLTQRVFEYAAKRFMNENIPPNDAVQTTITEVDVVYQEYIKESTGGRRLQEENGETGLRVEMEVKAEVYPGDPKDYEYDEVVGVGFEKNFTGFLDMLKDSSSFFRLNLQNTVSGAGGVGNDNTTGNEVNSTALTILYSCIGVASVAILAAGFAVVKNRRKERGISVEDHDSWSNESPPDSIDSPYTPRSADTNILSPNSLEVGKGVKKTQFNFQDSVSAQNDSTMSSAADALSSVDGTSLATKSANPKSPSQQSSYLPCNLNSSLDLYRSLYPIAEANSTKESTTQQDDVGGCGNWCPPDDQNNTKSPTSHTAGPFGASPPRSNGARYPMDSILKSESSHDSDDNSYEPVTPNQRNISMMNTPKTKNSVRSGGDNSKLLSSIAELSDDDTGVSSTADRRNGTGGKNDRYQINSTNANNPKRNRTYQTMKTLPSMEYSKDSTRKSGKNSVNDSLTYSKNSSQKKASVKSKGLDSLAYSVSRDSEDGNGLNQLTYSKSEDAGENTRTLDSLAYSLSSG